MKSKKIEPLYRILKNLLMIRIIIPITVVFLFTIGYLAYLRIETFVYQRNQLVQSTARTVNYYIEQSSKQLESIGNAANKVSKASLEIFMKSTWDSYQYFDTIYYLDKSEKILSMQPFDKRYIGMDMSRLPNYSKGPKGTLYLSKPFISLRTGEPTVYIRLSLENGDYVLGELRLNILQKEIDAQLELNSVQGEHLFIIDQYGTVLAHPHQTLVIQQTNMQYLGYEEYLNTEEKSILNIIDNRIRLVLAAEIGEYGWIVVDSIGFREAILTYIWVTMGAIAIFSAMIFWGLEKTKIKFKENVEEPLIKLGKSTTALAKNNFQEGKALANLNTTFLELNQLAHDFESMSDAIYISQSELEMKVEERTVELTAMNEELIAINEELNETLVKLRETQNHLIEVEKNAALNSLVAGVAHEINTPIGIAITASTYLETAYVDIETSLRNGTMSKNDFLKSMKSFENTLTLIITNLNRAAKLVNSFKMIAVTGKEEMCQSFDIEDLWDKVIQILTYECNPERIKFEINNQIAKEIKSYPSAISQILINLISNSIMHGFEEMDEGKISITTSISGKQMVIIYQDNGMGMSKEKLAQIYEPFFTTGRGKGMIGLGMSIVYNIVTAKLKGTIECESKLYEGTKFTLKFPVN